jgi:hypothetical protein
MKAMTCEQLGGACKMVFQAETFAEIAELSKQHGREMYQKKDELHLKAMAQMQSLMKTPEEMNSWFKAKQKEFDDLPETN